MGSGAAKGTGTREKSTVNKWSLFLRCRLGIYAVWFMSAVEPIVYNSRALADDFRNAGICDSDSIILHSSLRSVGRTDHGAESVVEALLETIGTDGHLLVPTFTYSLPVWNSEPFNLHKSKSRVGLITEYVRNRPGARRSFHPTHSVAVIGPEAETLIAGHIHCSPLGNSSPFDRMAERGAKILMLGTFQDTNSSLHLCEVKSGLPYIEVPFSRGQNYELGWFINEKEQVEYVQIFEVPGCSRGFRSIEPLLVANEAIKPVKIGSADCQLLEMPKLVKVAAEILRDDPTLLLCQIPNCAICPKRREFMTRLASSR